MEQTDTDNLFTRTIVAETDLRTPLSQPMNMALRHACKLARKLYVPTYICRYNILHIYYILHTRRAYCVIYTRQQQEEQTAKHISVYYVVECRFAALLTQVSQVRRQKTDLSLLYGYREREPEDPNQTGLVNKSVDPPPDLPPPTHPPERVGFDSRNQ